MTIADVINGKVKIPSLEMDAWTKFRKTDGEEIEVYDDILCQELVRRFDFFVNGGICWFYEDGVFVPDTNGSTAKTLIRKFIPQKVRKDTIISRVYRMLLSDKKLEVKDKEIINHPAHWINTKTGMFDPEKWEHHPHSPKYRSINQIPHPFTGEEPDKEDGKEIEAFLNEALPDKDNQKTIYEVSGNSCCCDCRFQKAIAIQGQGATGKSTLLNLIEATVGRDNISHVPLQKMEARFYPVQLIGKTVNSFSDLPSEQMPFTGNFKAAVCGEPINDSFKGKDQFDFIPYTKCWFSCNELPRVSDTSDGFYRRLILITMNVKPKKPDPKLTEKLTRPKAINYFLYKSIKAYHEALKKGSLTESAEARETVTDYRHHNDPIEGYMCEHWQITDNVQDRVARKELYEGYKAYCKDLGVQEKNANNFYDILRQKGYRRADLNGRRCFGYLKWKPATEDPESATEGATKGATEAEMLKIAEELFS